VYKAAELARITAPTLLILGDRERVYSIGAASAAARRLMPSIHVQIVKDAHHIAAISQPQQSTHNRCGSSPRRCLTLPSTRSLKSAAPVRGFLHRGGPFGGTGYSTCLLRAVPGADPSRLQQDHDEVHGCVQDQGG
jgi:hypothetical protein